MADCPWSEDAQAAGLPVSRKRKAKKADLENNRLKLKCLYIDDGKSKKQIIEIMQKEYDLLITEKQLKYHFETKWKISKNTTTKSRRSLHPPFSPDNQQLSSNIRNKPMNKLKRKRSLESSLQTVSPPATSKRYRVNHSLSTNSSIEPTQTLLRTDERTAHMSSGFLNSIEETLTTGSSPLQSTMPNIPYTSCDPPLFDIEELDTDELSMISNSDIFRDPQFLEASDWTEDTSFPGFTGFSDHGCQQAEVDYTLTDQTLNSVCSPASTWDFDQACSNILDLSELIGPFWNSPTPQQMSRPPSRTAKRSGFQSNALQLSRKPEKFEMLRLMSEFLRRARKTGNAQLKTAMIFSWLYCVLLTMRLEVDGVRLLRCRNDGANITISVPDPWARTFEVSLHIQQNLRGVVNNERKLRKFCYFLSPSFVFEMDNFHIYVAIETL